MELAIGILIGLILSIVILLVEIRLFLSNKKSITSAIGKVAKPPPQKGLIIEDKLSDEEINRLIS